MCFSSGPTVQKQADPVAPPAPIPPMQFADGTQGKDTAAKMRQQASRNSLLIDIPSSSNSGAGLNLPGQ